MEGDANIAESRAVPPPRAASSLALLEPFVAAALYATIVSALVPWWSVYQFNPDEGVNLMKAALVAEGFSLYSEIWNDQPPVFTFLLVPLQWLFPFNVNAARALVLAFAALTVFSLFRIVRRSEGRGPAWVAVIALAGERMFATTSVSVLIGLPAIALATAAMDQALAGARSGARFRFVVAGILFGLALQTKLFVALMIPALLLTPFVDRWEAGLRRRAIVDLAILVAFILGAFLLVAAAFAEAFFSQLIAPHSEATEVPRYIQWGGAQAVFDALTPQWLLALAALGMLISLWRFRTVRAIPIVWLAVAAAALIIHRPFWSHQAVLLEIPIAWLCGVALSGADMLPARRWIATAIAAVVLWLSASTLFDYRELVLDKFGGSLDSPLLTRNQGAARWVVADLPMDAYRAHSLVPPELAVFTEKRQLTGNLSSDEIAEIINRYLPQELLLRRFPQPRSFVTAIEDNYRPAPGQTRGIHAVRRQTPIASAPQIKRDTAIAALIIATADLASRATEGGFPAHYDLASGARYGRSRSDEPLKDDEIVVRPLGATQEVGQCMRRAHQVTGDELFQGVAVSAGKGLACAQRHSGGWSALATLLKPCDSPHDGVDDPNRPMTIDDRATPSALSFLLDLRSDFLADDQPPPAWLTPAIEKGLAALLDAQTDSGGWPQEFPTTGYSANLTFNDGAIPSVIEVLLKAHEQLGEQRYLDAALRGGEFILATQGPDEQAGWAQQYDHDLRPVAARAFEPAGYSSRETGEVMNALLDLHEANGDQRYADAVAKARGWLENSTIRPGVWSRLYEIGTNRPIYGDRDGSVHYDIAEISEERRAGYDWEMRFPSIVRAIERDDARLAGGTEALDASDEKARELEPLTTEQHAQVVKLIGQVGAEGRWANGPVVSTATFVANCNLLVRAIRDAP